MSKRSAWWLIAGIVGLSIIVRSIDLPLRSLWFDEAFSWRLVQFPFVEMIARDIADVHPPLYYVLLKIWATIFGSSVLALRSFSVTLAAATVGLVYLFAAYAFSSRHVGLVAALLTAVAGFQIQIAWEARMYTLGTALAVTSALLLLRVVREEKPAWLWTAVYGVSVALFAYTHYYALFSIAAQLLFIAGYLIVATHGRIGEVLQWRLAWRLATAGIIALALVAPWVPYFLQQNAQVQNAFWIPQLDRWSIPDTVYRMFIPALSLPRFQGGWLIWLSLTPLVGLGLIILWQIVQATRPRAAYADARWLVLMSGVIPIGLSILVSVTSQSVFQDRFFVFAHLFLLMSLSLFVVQLRPKLLSGAVICLVVVGMLLASGRYWRVLDIASKPGAHGAVQYLFTHYQPGEGVVASSPFVFFPVLHYTQEEFENRTAVKLYSEAGSIIHFAGGPILKDDDIVGPEIFTQHSSLWLVDTTGFGGTPLLPPGRWQATHTARFPEVFGHQGDVSVTRYQR